MSDFLFSPVNYGPDILYTSINALVSIVDMAEMQ